MAPGQTVVTATSHDSGCVCVCLAEVSRTVIEPKRQEIFLWVLDLSSPQSPLLRFLAL